MRKIWLIARREYLYNFRRRSFLFTAFGVPAFSFLMMFVIFNLLEGTFTETGQLGTVGYVDAAGVLAEAVERPEEFAAFPEAESAHAALLAGEIGAYFVLPEDFLQTGQVDAFAEENVPEGIQSQFTDFVEANLTLRVPPEVNLDRILNPMNLTMVEVATGESLENENAFIARFMTPFVFAFIFLMAVNTTSQFLMSGVVEEKENRMMEILITSVRPLEMLWGKVLGLGLLGLTQVLLWGAAGVLFLQAQPEIAAAVQISPDFVAIGLVYFVLGYFLNAAIMAGIGAAVTAEQEGRQFAGLLTLPAVLPFILMITFIQDANGAVPVLLSLFPLTAPVSMLMRIPMTAVPAWQIVLSLALLVAAVLGVIWLAAQVFRIGLLMYGKRLSLRAIFAAVRQGRKTMLTTAPEGR
ncbi:MAG: ABC transporter permease [Anaerolineae bacterium]|nr:ABC transporter permease [Anaerolineae bacterium]